MVLCCLFFGVKSFGDDSPYVCEYYAPNFAKVGNILISPCPSVRASVCRFKHLARVLKFHILKANKNVTVTIWSYPRVNAL